MSTVSPAPSVSPVNPQAGISHHPAFEFLGVDEIETLKIKVEAYRHIKTGALHYHLQADNSENVFLVAFRTVPMDSTGVAHILEHTALCGSDKYQVRDPFFMMIRRSLNTFMNAFTSSDWTAYPFASQNKKDFNNLLDVYLDAVFFSRLDELDFLQEGHRVEFAETDNPDSELLYKGVVFNEMKGAMSSTTSVLWQTMTKFLYPTSTYHYNSGGEPEDIPELSYPQLKAFHKTHYHPSNAVFMTFGDIPVLEHQSKFEDQALACFDKLDKEIRVSDEIRYQQPLQVKEPYALDLPEGESSEHKTHHLLGWLLGSCTSLDEVMETSLLSQVLLDNSASPLRKALEQTDLGTAPSPLCGLEDSNNEMCFLCGIEGGDPDKAQALEKLVLDVLQDIVENGVPKEQLESVLHQLELSQREIGGDGYPYGLQLILTGLSAAIHRTNPVDLLNLDPVIDSLRIKIKDPQFIKDLVKIKLLNNPHRILLSMNPDDELSAKKQKAEKQRLAIVKKAMSEADKQKVIEQTHALLERQGQHDDPEVLPKVGLQDVPPEISQPEGQQVTLAGGKSTRYAQGTNGLVYQQRIFDLPALDQQQLIQLPLYADCLTELGAGEKSYLEMQAWQSRVSGGIQAHSSIRGATQDAQITKGYFVFSGKALERNNLGLAELMQTTFNQIRFDESAKIAELIAQKRAWREQSVTDNGHGLAMMAATSGMNPTARLGHDTSGLAGLRTLKALDNQLVNEGIDAVRHLAEQFGEIHHKILHSPSQSMITTEGEKLETLEKEFASIWHTPSANGSFVPLAMDGVNDKVNSFWIANTQVNFCARAYPTVTLEHPDAAALSVLGGFLRNGYLHTEIREKGGAYGGGAGQDTNIAGFRFFSYRDPRLTETLDDFDKSLDWLMHHKHEDNQLEEAILGVIGGLDKPGSPAGEARQAFMNDLHGRTRAKLQSFRQAVLQVSLEDLRRVCETYLHPEQANTAVITNAATLEQLGDLGMRLEHL